mmetsp:Transcript_70619/g.139972  ORF Transcript_70619/g.139972 Transcript_70619/m.139972 type:complete len:233 (+) Transcript_70619:202-900(+)
MCAAVTTAGGARKIWPASAAFDPARVRERSEHGAPERVQRTSCQHRCTRKSLYTQVRRFGFHRSCNNPADERGPAQTPLLRAVIEATSADIVGDTLQILELVELHLAHYIVCLVKRTYAGNEEQVNFGRRHFQRVAIHWCRRRWRDHFEAVRGQQEIKLLISRKLCDIGRGERCGHCFSCATAHEADRTLLCWHSKGRASPRVADKALRDSRCSKFLTTSSQRVMRERYRGL